MSCRGALGAHEADARQRAGGAGEGQAAVQAAGPDGAAERSGRPQAAGAAKDGRLGEAEMRDFRDRASASQPSSCNFWTISALKRTDGHFGRNGDAAVDRMSVPTPSHCWYPPPLSAAPQA